MLGLVVGSLADQYADQGPANFAGNDPVNQNDPTGADPRLSQASYQLAMDLFNRTSDNGSAEWANGRDGFGASFTGDDATAIIMRLGAFNPLPGATQFANPGLVGTMPAFQQGTQNVPAHSSGTSQGVTVVPDGQAKKSPIDWDGAKDINDLWSYGHTIFDAAVQIAEAKAAARALYNPKTLSTLKTATRYNEAATGAGIALGVVDVVLSVQIYRNYLRTNGDKLKLCTNIAINALGLIPNPKTSGVSVVAGIAENAGAFDGFYEFVNRSSPMINPQTHLSHDFSND